MKRESFIKSRRGDWQRYEVLINSMQNKRENSWTGNNVSELSRLYRSICYDLSLVQSREWGSRLEEYLNDLVAHGHNCLYRDRPVSLYGMIDFIAIGFPRLLRRRWQPFLLAAALFLIPLIVSVFVGLTRPDLSAIVCGEEVLQQSIDMYSSDMYEQADWDYTGQRSFMFGFYVNNNTGIAFRAFALGALAGIGTCFVLLSNGISIGMVYGAILAAGEPAATNFSSFVITHGAFELTAIVIAGAAGFVLAQGILMPGERTRLDALRFHGRESVLMALGAGAMLTVAAVLEGYFSPLPIAPGFKYAAGSLAWLMVAAWLTFAGRERTSS